MKAIRIVLLVLIVIGVGLLLTQRLWIEPLVAWIVGEPGAVASAPALPGAHHLAPDAYPLYPGVTWGPEQRATYQGSSGYSVSSITAYDVTDLAGVAEPFEKYYADKLGAAGWRVDNAEAAGGPGSEVTAYIKGNDEIIISYHSVFKAGGANEPEQCPCDLTLAVFSE